MPNNFSAVVPQLLAQGLRSLREMAITPRLVNRDYDSVAAERGTTIDVPIASAVAVNQVSPSNTPPTTQSSTPTSVPVNMSEWYEAPFYLTDKEQMEVMAGYIPRKAEEAIRAIANYIDQDILGLYKKFYGFHGNKDSGAFLVPFTDASGNPTNTQDATKLRTILNNQVAPPDNRNVVFSPDVEGAALDIRAFQDASYSGSVQALLDGDLNRKLGFRWWMDQNVLSHTVGTVQTQGLTLQLVSDSSAGATTVNLNVSETGQSGTLVEGDILTFSGHSQTYVVTDTSVTITDASAGVAVNIQPGLQEAVDGSSTPVATTVEPAHEANIAFHRDAIAFVTRPLESSGQDGLGSIIQSAVDPVSGLTLRLEVRREHKQIRWSFDVLWGKAVVRRELGARLASAA